MLNKLYQTLIPESIRMPFFKWRKSRRRQKHERQWKIRSPEWIARWSDKRLELGDYYWLFILGCNNSGTTLLNQILESHPIIRSLPKEGQRVSKAIPYPVELGVGRIWTQKLDVFRWTEENDSRTLPRLRYDWAAKFSGKPPGILMEKSPPNIVRSRWLQENFKPNRFLAIVRSPYAVSEGIKRRQGYSIEMAANHWRKVHEILEEDRPYLDKYLCIRYEDLCEDMENTLQKIETFLELDTPFDRTLLQKEFNTHNLENTPNVVQNFNEKSIKRLTPEEIDLITEVTGEQMSHYHYEPIVTVK